MNKSDINYNLKAMKKCYEKAKAQYDKFFSKKCARHDMIVCVNMQEPSYRKRLYVFNPNDNKLIRAHHCSHGINSSNPKDRAYAIYFSNEPQSRKSCLGALVTGGTYYGKHGLSLRLNGLEEGKNDNAKSRYIVVHAANYVTDSYIMRNGRAGQSWGCPAVDPAISKSLIEMIKEGVFFYIYY